MNYHPEVFCDPYIEQFITDIGDSITNQIVKMFINFSEPYKEIFLIGVYETSIDIAIKVAEYKLKCKIESICNAYN